MSDTSRDILTAFEPLKNHEIFTPVRLANDMLDLLPKDVWKHPEYKFLDPATKSGVFLREIYIRLFDSLDGMGRFVAADGVVYDLNDPNQRTNHILKNMIYGISYSELTGYVSRRTLYGVRKANTDKQNASLDSFIKSKSFSAWDERERHDFIGRNNFNDYFDHTLFNVPDRVGYEAEGNIFYPADEVSKIKMESGDALIEEAHYPFMKSTETNHKFINQIKEGKMKFDVIIGNPPYQLQSAGSNAKALYQFFVMQALKLKPKFVSMIIPSRWMTGGGMGEGLKELAHTMRTGGETGGGLSFIKTFSDASECFVGVDIRGGVMYFLWENGYSGECELNGKRFDLGATEFIIDDEFKRSILQKVSSLSEPSVSKIVSKIRPFGFPSNFSDYSKTMGHGEQLRIYGYKDGIMKDTGGVGYIDRSAVTKNIDLIDQYKLFIPKASGDGRDGDVLGKPIVGLPGDVCTETYLVVGPFENKEQSNNMAEYIKTKFFRYMVSMIKTTQNTTSRVYEYVPMLDMDKRWTEKELYAKYGLSEDEIAEIERSIRDKSGD